MRAPVSPAPLQKPVPALASSWEEGRCSFSDGTLSYSDRSHQAGIRLDVPLSAGRSIHCSSDITVVMTMESAVVALGGRAVLDGRLSLGSIGEIFTLANSYSLDLGQITEEDGGRLSERVVDGRLHVSSVRGREWTIDLLNPGRWDIY